MLVCNSPQFYIVKTTHGISMHQLLNGYLPELTAILGSFLLPLCTNTRNTPTEVMSGGGGESQSGRQRLRVSTLKTANWHPLEPFSALRLHIKQIKPAESTAKLISQTHQPVM